MWLCGEPEYINHAYSLVYMIDLYALLPRMLYYKLLTLRYGAPWFIPVFWGWNRWCSSGFFLCCVFCFVLFVFVLSLLYNFTSISGSPLFILDNICLFSGECLRIYIILAKKQETRKTECFILKTWWYVVDLNMIIILAQSETVFVLLYCALCLAQYDKQIHSISQSQQNGTCSKWSQNLYMKLCYSQTMSCILTLQLFYWPFLQCLH